MSIVCQVIIVFFSTLMADFSWSMYIKLLSKNKDLKAACWSAFITLIGGITIIGYTANHWLIIPAIVGGFIGTYLSKYFNKK